MDIANKALPEINPFDPEILQEPYAYFQKLRAEAPVYKDPNLGIVFVSTYEMIYEVNRQPKLFSNRFGQVLRAGAPEEIDPEVAEIAEQGYPSVDTMLTADPPEHTRFRKLAAKAFTYKRVMQMGDYVETVANEIIDGFVGDGACEFKSTFANELPMRVIADQLGVPRSDMPKFRVWSDAFVDQLGGVADRDRKLDAMRKIVEYQHYFADVIEQKRLNPTEDVISDLVHATLEEEGDPRGLSVPEILSIMQQLLVAGNETTAHSLTAGIYYLIQNPDQMQALIEDPTLVDNFVEEVLRYLSPTNNMWRVTLEDTVLGGVEIPKHTMILLRYGAANRDERKFEDPERFDMYRENAKEHLAFGAGIHTCIGAQLARKEMAVAFPILLERLKNIRFAQGKNTFQYDPNLLLRGVLQLHIEFDG